MRRYRSSLIVAVGLVLIVAACSVIRAENSLRIYRRPQPNPAEADTIARPTAASWEPAEVTAADGVALRGWLFLPRTPNGSAAILLHGVSDSRSGVSTQARFLLGQGILRADARRPGPWRKRRYAHQLRHCRSR